MSHTERSLPPAGTVKVVNVDEFYDNLRHPTPDAAIEAAIRAAAALTNPQTGARAILRFRRGRTYYVRRKQFAMPESGLVDIDMNGAQLVCPRSPPAASGEPQ